MCMCICMACSCCCRRERRRSLICSVSVSLGSLLAARPLSAPSAALSFASPDEKSVTRTHAKVKRLPCERGGTVGGARVEGDGSLCLSSQLPVSDRVHSILFVCVRLPLIAAAPRRPAPIAIVAAAAVARVIAMTVAAVAAAVARAAAPAAATAAAAAASADDDRRRRADGTRRPSRPPPA